MLPSITVLTPTYGRTKALAECVYSFLAQDYAGRAEMIVLNDRIDQRLTLGPNSEGWDVRPVTIINALQPYPDLGTKRNALVERASTQLVAFWDDDDIYLPNALTRLVERYTARLAQKRRSGRESHCWQLQKTGGPDGVGGKIAFGDDLELILRDSGPMWSMVVERSAVLDVSGFPAWDRKQDIDLARKLIQARWVGAESNTPGIPSCIHRLGGTPYTHAIDFTAWSSPADNERSAAFHSAATSALIDLGEEPRGDVRIVPEWRLDWSALTKAAWDAIPYRANVPNLGFPPTHF